MARLRKDAHESSTSQALAAEHEFEEVVNDALPTLTGHDTQDLHSRIPITSKQRQTQSLHDSPIDISQGLHLESQTVLYLAYGSNLSDKKFLGDRGIRPVSSINVQVPELCMTFNLAGIPYIEPCFANSAYRRDDGSAIIDALDEKTSLMTTTREYRKDQWKKPMIGVVYELTTRDYAKVLSTEGAGSSYQDIVVACYPFASSDPSVPAPWKPETTAFKAHTLFAPRTKADGSRMREPSYSQPSARYLKFLTEGAAQHGLPHEYQQYLASIRPYQIRSFRQRVGRTLFSVMWVSMVMIIMRLGKQLSDETGKGPAWYTALLKGVFSATWWTYDWVMKPLFGDGERDTTT
jgi:hypothetical protein